MTETLELFPEAAPQSLLPNIIRTRDTAPTKWSRRREKITVTISVV